MELTGSSRVSKICGIGPMHRLTYLPILVPTFFGSMSAISETGIGIRTTLVQTQRNVGIINDFWYSFGHWGNISFLLWACDSLKISVAH